MNLITLFEELKKIIEKNNNIVWTIISSVQVGKFRQNITTDIDNTEFLKMLKYSLYSK